MKLGMNIEYLSRDIGLEASAELLKSEGILCLDYSPAFSETDDEVSKTAELFEKYGLSVYQTHAPFNRYGTLKSIEEHKATVVRCLENTIRLGAKFMVVHGDEFDFDNLEYSKEAVLRYNFEYFAPVVEKAEKYGIQIAFENVFEDNAKGRPRFCSKTEDLAELIAKFNSENVCACWDYGHGAVANREASGDAIRYLGKTIKCTHVHDNYLYYDMHLIPFFGKIDWKDCMDATRLTDVEVMSFELVYGKHFPETAPHIAELLKTTGDKLQNL